MNNLYKQNELYITEYRKTRGSWSLLTEKPEYFSNHVFSTQTNTF